MKKKYLSKAIMSIFLCSVALTCTGAWAVGDDDDEGSICCTG